MNNTELAKSRVKELPGVLQALENGILSGDINPNEMHGVIKAFDSWIEYIKKNKPIQDAMERAFDLEANGAKTIKYNDVTITKNERDSWDFSPCPENDTLLINEAEIKRLKEQNKAIEETLKARYKIDDLTNISTGEVVSVIKPIKKGSTKYFS